MLDAHAAYAVGSNDERRVTVCADDGVPLSVQEFGRHDAELTVVFVHGHCLRSESWAFLRDCLDREWGPDVRTVFYDHRGHGDSGAGPVDTYTIDQLGRDLDAVIRTVVPVGPIVLVGHSMGAMAAMVYARQNPHSIGDRIVGVGLLATAASRITEAGLGRCLRRPAVTVLQVAVRRAPALMRASKRLSRSVCEPIVRNAGFGNRKVSPRVVAFAAAMLNDTSIVTMSSFLGSLIEFDESESLPALGRIPTLVLGGSADLMTPFEHSVAIASMMPGSNLVCLDGAGHGVIFDRAADVARSIFDLVDRARGTALSSDATTFVAAG